MSKRKLFGTDGVRGKANVYPMTGEVAFYLGRSVTAYFQGLQKKSRPTIVIGKDTRLSCYMLEQAFSAGVCAQGGRALLTGPLPTPGIAFVTQSMRADAGVMISASHNPYYDNGIKVFDANGHKLPDSVELEIEKMVLDPGLIPQKFNENLGSAKRVDEIAGRYIVQVKATFSQKYSLEGMRIVVDAANGAGYKVAPMVFEELGAEVITVGDKPNGTNINDQVGALHPEKCAALVKKYRADLGICLDGDADRICVIDNDGSVVDGDQVLGILAKFLLDTKELDNNEVVGTVMSNLGLELYCKKLGINFFRTAVGDRYIAERMKFSQAVFGGEPSGHIIFKNYATTGDGILAGLKVIEALKYYKKNLADLIKEIPLTPQILENVKVKEKVPFENLPKLQKELKRVEEELGETGRVLLRYSGTENLARIMVEAQDKDKVCEFVKDLRLALEEDMK